MAIERGVRSTDDARICRPRAGPPGGDASAGDAGARCRARADHRGRRAQPRRSRSTSSDVRSASGSTNDGPGSARRGRRRSSTCSTPRAGADPSAQIGPKRAGSSAGGGEARRPVINAARSAAEPGPVEMPHGPCPARSHRPSTPGTRPTSGRPSWLSGRAQTRTAPTDPSRSPARTGPRARRVAGSTPYLGFLVEERRPERAGRPRRDEAEVRAVRGIGVGGGSPSAGPSSGSMSISASSSTCRGGASSVTATTTPASSRRPPAPTEGSTSWALHGPPGDHDVRGWDQRAIRQANAARAAGFDHRRGRGAEADVNTAPRRERRVGHGRRRGLDWKTDLEPARSDVRTERGLGASGGTRRERLRTQTGKVVGERDRDPATTSMSCDTSSIPAGSARS